MDDGDEASSDPAAQAAENESTADGAANGDGDARKLRGLSDVVDRLRKRAENDDDGQLSLGEVVDDIGSNAHGPLLLVPAVIALFPLTGGIPGVSIVTGTWIILVAVQILLSADEMWLPGFLERRSLSAKTVAKAADKAEPWVNRIEKLIRSRLDFLTGAVGVRVVALVSILLAATMYPLAIIPGGVAAPSGAITLLALGLTASDGVLVAIGLAASAAAGYGTWLLLT